MKKWFIDDLISCFFISLTILTVITNVCMRYFFNSPLRSAEEFSTICFIWAVFVGGAAAYRKKMHMGIDILTQLLPKKYENYIICLVNIFMVIINGTFTYLSLTFTISSKLKTTAVLGVSFVYVNLALFVGFGLIFLYSLQFTKKSLENIKLKKNNNKENMEVILND